MTYVQVLEMHGKSVPENARIRIMLNVFALKIDAQPLQDTLMLADMSQNTGFGTIRTDGNVPTLTTNSYPHSFQAATKLTTYHVAALSGLDTTKMKFAKNMNPTWFRARVGLGVHVANYGMVLMGALAPPMSQMLGGTDAEIEG